MRKVFPLVLCGAVFLGSCTLFQGGDEFTSLYKAHVQAEIRQLDVITETLGLQRKEQTTGDIETSFSVPLLFSGVLSSQYDIKAFERDADLRFSDFRLNYESLMGTGGIEAKELGLISQDGDAYFLFKGLSDTTLLTPEMLDVFKVYDGKWLSWTRDDAMRSLSGASADEVLATTVVNNLSKMRLADLEKYLTEYIVWKPTGSPTQSGSMQVYSVDLDRDAIIGLVGAVNQDLTGSGMSDLEKTDLRTVLDSINFQGTLALDPSDASVSHLDATISQSGGTILAKLSTKQSKDGLSIKLDSIPTGAIIDIGLTYTRDEFRGNMSLSQSGIEMGSVNLLANYADNVLSKLDLELAGQGLSVRMTHNRASDGNFDGNLQLPVGAMSWNGKLDGKKLSALSVKGALQGGAVTMNLTQSGGELRGPMILKNGDEVAFQANIKLLLDAGKFALGVDVPDETGSGSMFSLATRMSYAISAYEKKIAPPSSTESLQSFIDALNAVVPETPDLSDMDMTDTSLSGSLISSDTPSLSN